MTWIYTIDLIGTLVFAISGVLASMEKKFDLVGAFILGLVTAVGGGTLRDIMIGTTPVGWMNDLNYIYIVLAALPISYFFRIRILKLRRSMFLFDTIGISVFTLLGLQKGLTFNLHPIIALIMGMISAVFGGVLRDVLTNKIPLIFEKEIYASACLAGGITYLTLNCFKISENIIFVISTAVIVIIRVISVRFHLQLPKIKDDLFSNK